MSTEDYRQPDHREHPETHTDATNPTPDQPTPVDRIAQECADDAWNAGYKVLLEHGSNPAFRDFLAEATTPIIAAAIAKAVEQERSEANERMQVVMDAEAILTRKVEMERNRIMAERDQFRATVERLNITNKELERAAERTLVEMKQLLSAATQDITQLRAALDQAEGALKAAKTQLGVFRCHCIAEQFSAQQSAVTKAIFKAQQALARIAAIKNGGAT